MKEVNKRTDILDLKGMKRQFDDGAYYDILYDFAGVVMKANMKAVETGAAPNQIAAIFRKTANAFMNLCLIDDITMKWAETKPEPEKTPEFLPVEETRPNNMIVRDGWGMCPDCGRKMVKVNTDTIIVGCPCYCKHCKTEFVINWRNDSEFKEFAKPKEHYRQPRQMSEIEIYDRSVSGNGLKNFLYTGTSSTERVAMKL